MAASLTLRVIFALLVGANRIAIVNKQHSKAKRGIQPATLDGKRSLLRLMVASNELAVRSQRTHYAIGENPFSPPGTTQLSC